MNFQLELDMLYFYITTFLDVMEINIYFLHLIIIKKQFIGFNYCIEIIEYNIVTLFRILDLTFNIIYIYTCILKIILLEIIIIFLNLLIILLLLLIIVPIFFF